MKRYDENEQLVLKHRTETVGKNDNQDASDADTIDLSAEAQKLEVELRETKEEEK